MNLVIAHEENNKEYFNEIIRIFKITPGKDNVLEVVVKRGHCGDVEDQFNNQTSSARGINMFENPPNLICDITVFCSLRDRNEIYSNEHLVPTYGCIGFDKVVYMPWPIL